MTSTRRLMRLVFATILGSGGVIAAPSFALASCVLPPPFPESIREAPAVFVGTVVDLRDGDRTATVEVREVWKGPSIASEVEVRGGVIRGDGFTSVDRAFKLSRDYLFVPYERKGSVFRDNACTRTTLFRAELSRFRPVSASEPSPTALPDTASPEADEGDALPWLLAGGALVGSALLALVLLRRR